MPSILVSLISDQFVPNLVLMKHKRYDQYWFVSTNRMETAGATASLCTVCGISKEQSVIIPVDETSFPSCFSAIQTMYEQLCSGGNASETYTFDVHITGGTKITALAVHSFFADKPNAVLLYKSSIKDSIYTRNYHTIDSTSFTVDTPITLEEYLIASGTKFTPSNFAKKNTLIADSALTARMFSAFGDAKDRSPFHAAQKARKDNGRILKLDDNEKNSLRTYLQTLQYPRTLEQCTKDDFKYLSGDWFEEWTYSLIKHHLQLDDSAIGMGLQLKPKRKDEDASNEFDVMFIHKHTLYIIECKTSLQSGKGDIFNDTMYKMATLRSRFGLTPKALLFTLDTIKNTAPDGKREMEETYKKRAGSSVGITVCDGVDLQCENPFVHEPLNSFFR
jgi:hypothetical protein